MKLHVLWTNLSTKFDQEIRDVLSCFQGQLFSVLVTLRLLRWYFMSLEIDILPSYVNRCVNMTDDVDPICINGCIFRVFCSSENHQKLPGSLHNRAMLLKFSTSFQCD